LAQEQFLLFPSVNWTVLSIAHLQRDPSKIRQRRLSESQLGAHSDFLIGRVATFGHSHVWSAQEPFLLFPSVNFGSRRRIRRRGTQRFVPGGGKSAIVSGEPSGPMTQLPRGR
jgi:hypothetical protein